MFESWTEQGTATCITDTSQHDIVVQARAAQISDPFCHEHHVTHQQTIRVGHPHFLSFGFRQGYREVAATVAEEHPRTDTACAHILLDPFQLPALSLLRTLHGNTTGMWYVSVYPFA